MDRRQKKKKKKKKMMMMIMNSGRDSGETPALWVAVQLVSDKLAAACGSPAAYHTLFTAAVLRVLRYISSSGIDSTLTA